MVHRAERVHRLQERPPCELDASFLHGLLAGLTNGRTGRAKEMAEVLHRRYCTEPPEKYVQIGQALDMSQQHARRLGSRAVRLLAEASALDMLARMGQRGSRLWAAIKSERQRRTS